MTPAAERETVITWSDADAGMAHVYTCQPRMMRVLARHPRAQLVETHYDQAGKVTGVEYDLPVVCIRITSGSRKGRPLSESQRQAAVERLRAARNVRGGATLASKQQRNAEVLP